MKTAPALFATTALIFAQGAFAADPSAKNEATIEYKKNGGYESKAASESTATGGTTRASKKTVDVDYDDDGKGSAEVKSEETRDPKGLMNKTTNKDNTSIEEKERGGYVKKTTSEHMNSKGEKVSVDTKIDREVDKDGNVTVEKSTDKAVDPKGLLNKKTTSTTKKTVNGSVTENSVDD